MGFLVISSPNQATSHFNCHPKVHENGGGVIAMIVMMMIMLMIKIIIMIIMVILIMVEILTIMSGYVSLTLSCVLFHVFLMVCVH